MVLASRLEGGKERPDQQVLKTLIKSSTEEEREQIYKNTFNDILELYDEGKLNEGSQKLIALLEYLFNISNYDKYLKFISDFRINLDSKFKKNPVKLETIHESAFKHIVMPAIDKKLRRGSEKLNRIFELFNYHGHETISRATSQSAYKTGRAITKIGKGDLLTSIGQNISIGNKNLRIGLESWLEKFYRKLETYAKTHRDYEEVLAKIAKLKKGQQDVNMKERKKIYGKKVQLDKLRQMKLSGSSQQDKNKHLQKILQLESEIQEQERNFEKKKQNTKKILEKQEQETRQKLVGHLQFLWSILTNKQLPIPKQVSKKVLSTILQQQQSAKPTKPSKKSNT